MLFFYYILENKKTFTNSCADLTDECDFSVGLVCDLSSDGVKMCL